MAKKKGVGSLAQGQQLKLRGVLMKQLMKDAKAKQQQLMKDAKADKLAKAAAAKADGVFGFTSFKGKMPVGVYADLLEMAMGMQKKFSDLQKKLSDLELKAALAERDLKDSKTQLLLERDMRAILSDVLPKNKKPANLEAWLKKPSSQDRRHVRRPRQPPTPQAAVIPHGRVSSPPLGCWGLLLCGRVLLTACLAFAGFLSALQGRAQDQSRQQRKHGHGRRHREQTRGALAPRVLQRPP